MQPATSNQRRANIRAYSSALLILIASRVVVILALFFSVRFVKPSIHAVGETDVPWYQYLLRWDAGWYLQIVRDGYSHTGDELTQQSINFSPVYPLFCKGVSVLFGLPPGVALVIVSNLLLVIGIILLFKLIRDDYGDDVAFYSLAALCFFPSSMFFSAGYTESLALGLIAGCFLLLKRKRYVFASVLIGLAVGTRLMSLVLIPPLLWELWRDLAPNKKRLFVTGGASLILATSGLWLYMIYLWAAFNSPLSIMTSKRAWHGSGSSGELFRVLTLQPFQHLLDIWRDGPIPETLAPWFFVLFIFLLIVFRKLLPVSYTLYAAGGLLMPYFLASANRGFGSFTRYLMLIFPFFIILGEILRKRTWLALTVIGVFAALLFMHAAFYAQAYWAG
ncbi:MAG: hypothetical protein AABN95_09165 [Acidobacteriota bacterium]